jgi:23S rRNA pseudouridine1911/1915/1917 synthase
METHIVPKDLADISAKSFLRQYVGTSTTLWRRIKHSGTFKVNGKPCIAALTMLHAGDEVAWELARRNHILPVDLPLDIRYEDDWLMIVNKPAGMVVHPTGHHREDTLANAVLWYYQQTGQAWDFHPIHRLDRLTSGLVCIAKAPQVQYQLFKNGQKQFKRCYLALIPGRLDPPDGTIEAPLERTPDSIIKRMVAPDGQPAITHYHTLRSQEHISLLELQLETGRTHQIRVHMAHLGHPLLGDDLYGGDHALISRQALHAYKLSFQHPMTKEKITIRQEMPEDMKELTAKYLPDMI